MNKYQESLNNLKSIDLDLVLNSTDYEIADKVSIYGISDYPNLEMQEDINNLQELIDKQEQYRWHDLRKDPNDLPKEEYGKLLVYIQGYISKNIYPKIIWYQDNKLFDASGEVIAWKYIEEFKDE